VLCAIRRFDLARLPLYLVHKELGTIKSLEEHGRALHRAARAADRVAAPPGGCEPKARPAPLRVVRPDASTC